MYIPATYQMHEKADAVAFMRRFSFASIVSLKEGNLVATHLPFVVQQRGDDIILLSHFAKANLHWQLITGQENLVIFTEPHAYISPSHYEKKQNVPTWNYIAVHCYGKASIISEEERVADVLGAMIATYEAVYQQQWDALPGSYKSGMMKGIVAFEILVTALDAKQKLSQNKTEAERKKIVDTLATSANTNDQLVAGYMRDTLSMTERS